MLEWSAGENDEATEVRIEFEPLDDDSTMVRISEGTWPQTQGNLERSYGNCMGWTQMIASMKTYLEHGLNLRDGYFK